MDITQSASQTAIKFFPMANEKHSSSNALLVQAITDKEKRSLFIFSPSSNYTFLKSAIVSSLCFSCRIRSSKSIINLFFWSQFLDTFQSF